MARSKGDTVLEQKWCDQCRQHVMAERTKGISDGMGCLLTFLTCGLFLLLWIPIMIMSAFYSFDCPHCGSDLGR